MSVLQEKHSGTDSKTVSRRKRRVDAAIRFQNPDQIPLLLLNRDQLDGDILICWTLALQDENRVTEWGIRFESLNDGTMGQMGKPPVSTWEDLNHFEFPKENMEMRIRNVREFKKGTDEYYRLGSLNLSGFTCYCGLRGFENAMTDFLLDHDEACSLLDKIFAFEDRLITIAAEQGLDGVIFWDDWGSQNGLLMSPSTWRQIFKPRYRNQFKKAHQLGLTVWFHCCGAIDPIIRDLNEIGVDVLNISQPNVVHIEEVGAHLSGKQCFMLPISYQTVSINGSPSDIETEARRLHSVLATDKGGFIGYIEDYKCMGMSEQNYHACKNAFSTLLIQSRD